MPGIESIKSILFFIDSGKLLELIKDLISFSKIFNSVSKAAIIFSELVILIDNPCKGSPIIIASCAVSTNLL